MTNLRWGTHQENMDDMARNGHAQKGIANKKAKLNELKVREIRALWKTGRFTMERLARAYGVSDSNIEFIVNRKSWKHVL